MTGRAGESHASNSRVNKLAQCGERGRGRQPDSGRGEEYSGMENTMSSLASIGR